MGVRHLVTADELEGMGREDLELVTKAGVLPGFTLRLSRLFAEVE